MKRTKRRTRYYFVAVEGDDRTHWLYVAVRPWQKLTDQVWAAMRGKGPWRGWRADEVSRAEAEGAFRASAAEPFDWEASA